MRGRFLRFLVRPRISLDLTDCLFFGSSGGRMSRRWSRTIYVGNLPGDIREREVEDLFYKVGNLFLVIKEGICVKLYVTSRRLDSTP